VLNGLNRLKNKYNIVVVDADIKGVGDGVVDVKMTFIHP
jgi:type II secretory pathway component PulM